MKVLVHERTVNRIKIRQTEKTRSRGGGKMKRMTKTMKGRKREKPETECNWFYDGFQLHGFLPKHLSNTHTQTLNFAVFS